MAIFFDLDGTLIDSKLRLYRLFQELVSQSKFTFDEYWSLKQNKINHAAVLKNYFDYDSKDIYLFEQNWLLQIESDEYLQYDKPFSGVTNYLLSLKERKFELYLVTARQFKVKVLSQIDLFGWSEIFTDILVTEQRSTKTDLIKSLLHCESNDWIVGDTGADILIGKSLGIKTACVLSGFLNELVLKEYDPDIMLSSVLDFNPF